MKRIILLIATVVAATVAAHARITIEECVAKAEAHYPVIRKYALLDATTAVELSDINKGWLPRLGLSAQATVQNVVPEFPPMLAGVLQQLGQEVKGLGRLQYKAALDVSQPVWDGGTASARRESVRSAEAVQRASLGVDLYAVRQRVENICFAILLTRQQIEQSRETHRVLMANLERMRAMQRGGTATQADADMIEAQALSLGQTIAQAETALHGYSRALELLIGENLDGRAIVKPQAQLPAAMESARPELSLFDSQLRANNASRRLADTQLMPRVGFFAQAYYGYPGMDYFKGMMNRRLTFNAMAGVKLTWNIDALYTRRNTSTRAAIAADRISADRETFLLNTRVRQTSELAAIEGLKRVMADDERIIILRSNVRKAAERQLEAGVIDATSLLTKISDENLARLSASMHELQLLQEIYKLKYTLNQ